MFSISRVSSIADLPGPVAVCCHDAGGANLVAAWVAGAPRRDFRLCVEGPARGIFATAAPQLLPSALPVSLDGAASLLSGSGWGSDLEHRARVEARRRGILVVAVLDHWVNYGMRFVRGGIQSLPDVAVVTDLQAAVLAAEAFGAACQIEVWENAYLQREVAAVRSFPRLDPPTAAPHLLVVLEPLRAEWLQAAEQAEFRCLDYLIEHLSRLFPNPDLVQIRLRPHPSERQDKYLSWLGRQQRRETPRLSTSASLAEDLAWADVAAGLNSYALVVALESGRRAVSYLPPGAPPCVLRDARLEFLNPQSRGDA